MRKLWGTKIRDHGTKHDCQEKKGRIN
jgi:hypothetical protein